MQSAKCMSKSTTTTTAGEGAEWEHKRSNPCCFQMGRLSLTEGWHGGYVTQEPEEGIDGKSRAQEPSRGQHQSTNQSLLILILPHVF